LGGISLATQAIELVPTHLSVAWFAVRHIRAPRLSMHSADLDDICQVAYTRVVQWNTVQDGIPDYTH